MHERLQKLIEFFFYFLLLFTPLILYPYTSEIFEFNKIVFVYIMTILITTSWVLKAVILRKTVFTRTLLDIPMTVFLLSQILSTFFSIDPRTSVLGYYSRFNGGLLSQISYALLYWAFVSNMDPKAVVKSIKLLLVSTLITSLWAVFEHFGHSFSCLIFPEFSAFDVSCWVQDVKNRVFSTFGQPNWLAAWMAAIIPLTWGIAVISKSLDPNSKQTSNFKSKIPKTLFNFHLSVVVYFLSALFFAALIFTKSRSGLLGFGVSVLAFWGIIFLNKLKTRRFAYLFPIFLVFAVSYLGIFLIFNTTRLPTINSHSETPPTPENAPAGPALEVGGTESGKIRLIVWKGAADIWKNYPLLGSGVETFAYSYYKFKPPEHNLTSEWDFLYNKAHNEYLNFLATTGIIGFLAYLILVFFGLLIFLKAQLTNNQTPNNQQILNNQKLKLSDNGVLVIGVFAGYVSILVTNFFGFSVVSVSLLFFLFPAFSTVLAKSDLQTSPARIVKLDIGQKFVLFFVILTTICLLLSTIKYWHNDFLFAQAKREHESQNMESARQTFLDLVKKSPREPIYWDQLSEVTTTIAISQSENGEEELARQHANSAISESKQAVALSPANVNFKRNLGLRYINLSGIDSNYLIESQKILLQALDQAPTDAKLLYSIAGNYLRVGDIQESIKALEKTIKLKPNYERARYTLALIYIEIDEKEKAKTELEYILTNINPGNESAKETLMQLTPTDN